MKSFLQFDQRQTDSKSSSIYEIDFAMEPVFLTKASKEIPSSLIIQVIVMVFLLLLLMFVHLMLFLMSEFSVFVIKITKMESPEIVFYTTNKEIPPNSKILHSVMESVAFGSAIILAMLQIYSHGNGEKLFGGCLSLYHAFVISLMFTFTGAASALVIEKKPKVARLCRWYSLISAASALAILAYPIYFACFRWADH